MTSLTRTPGVLMPKSLLIACGAFGPRLPATGVAAALARGVREGGAPAPDVCVLPLADEAEAEARHEHEHEHDVRGLLEALDFDARMRGARAVVVGAARLRERTLLGSVVFEIATRARQGGVPAYAVTGEDALAPFDARMLDLQLVLQARSRGALVAAGRKLAGLA